MVKHVKKSSPRKVIIKWAEKNHQLDAATRRGINFIPDDEPEYEENHEQCQKKIEDKDSLSDALQIHPTSQPERLKLEGDLVQVSAPGWKRQN